MIKTVIFDFDGTLADTLPIVYKGFQHIFRTYRNEEVTDEGVKAMFGPAEDDMIQKHFSEEQVPFAIEAFHNYYSKHHKTWVKPSKEIEDLLHFIRAHQLHLAVVTGKGRQSLDLSLKVLDMSDLFDMTITGDEVTRAKPEPEGILKVLDALDTPPHEAIYVGDSDGDIQAGQSAGVETAGVQWLPNYQTHAFTTHPDHVFTKMSDFKEFLQERI